MNEFKFSEYTGLGVINRTPNSFSDAGKSLNDLYFLEQLKELIKRKKFIIDIGFESTAPMNQKISNEDEWDRFLLFKDLIQNIELNQSIISLDSYKEENMLRMISSLKNDHPQCRFLINDVSGLCSDFLLDYLASQEGQDVGYIYTFTNIPHKDKVHAHMNYLNEDEDIIKQVFNKFHVIHRQFLNRQIDHKLLLDPGFGFSKSFLQNWALIERIDELTQLLVNDKIRNPLVIGLSKKSFMKKMLNVDSGDETEDLHRRCIKKMLSQTHSKLLFRVHHPEICD
jgi:dihydropteroate synthase